MAYLEAAGFLAHAHAWAHPLDLALRDLGLTASTVLAAAGAPHRALPQTFAATLNTAAWAEPPLEELPAGDAAITEALALARMLRRVAGKSGTTALDSGIAVVEVLQGLGASALDAAGFARLWDSIVPQSVRRHRRFATREGQGAAPHLPPLLAAAYAAATWMEAGIAERPTPAQALWLAAAVLARTGVLRVVVLPVWAAYPALGFGDRDALPTLRADAARRLIGPDLPVTWPLACLHLVADSARMGARELERLEAAAEKGRELVARADQRSRLPDAIDALLRAPVLTSTALATKLKTAPQTATTLLGELQARGLIREVTGRGRFRAYAI